MTQGELDLIIINIFENKEKAAQALDVTVQNITRKSKKEDKTEDRFYKYKCQIEDYVNKTLQSNGIPTTFKVDGFKEAICLWYKYKDTIIPVFQRAGMKTRDFVDALYFNSDQTDHDLTQQMVLEKYVYQIENLRYEYTQLEDISQEWLRPYTFYALKKSVKLEVNERYCYFFELLFKSLFSETENELIGLIKSLPDKSYENKIIECGYNCVFINVIIDFAAKNIKIPCLNHCNLTYLLKDSNDFRLKNNDVIYFCQESYYLNSPLLRLVYGEYFGVKIKETDACQYNYRIDNIDQYFLLQQFLIVIRGELEINVFENINNDEFELRQTINKNENLTEMQRTLFMLKDDIPDGIAEGIGKAYKNESVYIKDHINNISRRYPHPQFIHLEYLIDRNLNFKRTQAFLFNENILFYDGKRFELKDNPIYKKKSVPTNP